MTQAQWQRITGQTPSSYKPPKVVGGVPITSLHPIESISWEDASRVVGQLGLTLPTEAQWEYAARAGTVTPWWTGQGFESLRGHANLADQSAARSGASWRAIERWPDLDDGYPVHAPVGSYGESPFGLADMNGNVWEWCRDFNNRYDRHAAGPKDGLRMAPVASWHIARGGGFSNDVAAARSAARYTHATTYSSEDLGVRPARELEP